MSDFPITTGGDPDLEFQGRHAFEEPFVGLMMAIGWIAHRNIDKAYDIGFWRFCDASERNAAFFAAREELWRVLLTGEIRAIGVDARGDDVDIPALPWRHLEFASAVDAVVSYRDSSRCYGAVAVETSKLLELWPATPAVTGAEPRKRGPKPSKGPQVIEAMRRAAAGDYDLHGAADKELVAKFGVPFRAGRSTVLRARDAVLSEINSGQLGTKNN